MSMPSNTRHNSKHFNEYNQRIIPEQKSYYISKQSTNTHNPNEEDQDLYIKCCNCEHMIKISDADFHSTKCTSISQTSLQSSFLPITDQVNIQIESYKGVVQENKKYFPGFTNVWENLLDCMSQLQAANDAASTHIVKVRKLLYFLRMLEVKYKGPFNGLLAIYKIQVLAKEKCRLLIDRYKSIYSKGTKSKELEGIKSVIMEQRLSNYSSSSPIGDRKSFNDIDLQRISTPINTTSADSKFNDTRADATLKRQFYYKCQLIKRKLGRMHPGFWVESAPLFNYVKKNRIPMYKWDLFIEEELNNNASNWIDSAQLAKYNIIKKKNQGRLECIPEITSSYRDEM